MTDLRDRLSTADKNLANANNEIERLDEELALLKVSLSGDSDPTLVQQELNKTRHELQQALEEVEKLKLSGSVERDMKTKALAQDEAASIVSGLLPAKKNDDSPVAIQRTKSSIDKDMSRSGDRSQGSNSPSAIDRSLSMSGEFTTSGGSKAGSRRSSVNIERTDSGRLGGSSSGRRASLGATPKTHNAKDIYH